MSLDIQLVMELDTGNTPYTVVLFEANLTHNLGEMARKCGLYDVMWRPYRLTNVPDKDEGLLTIQAVSLISSLVVGIMELDHNHTKYKAFNPENEWGNFDGLLEVAKELLEACENYPKAIVKVDR